MNRDRIRTLNQKIEKVVFLHTALVQYLCVIPLCDTFVRYPCPMTLNDDSLVRCSCGMLLFDTLVQLLYSIPLFARVLLDTFVLLLLL